MIRFGGDEGFELKATFIRNVSITWKWGKEQPITEKGFCLIWSFFYVPSRQENTRHLGTCVHGCSQKEGLVQVCFCRGEFQQESVCTRGHATVMSKEENIETHNDLGGVVGI